MKKKSRKFWRKTWLYMKVNAGMIYITLIPIFTLIYMLPWVKLNVAKQTAVQCMYFSITIITTLGLGDIYPTNRFGQIVVSLETLLGVCLIGFYLAGLSLRANIKAKDMTTEELELWMEKNKNWKDVDPDAKLK